MQLMAEILFWISAGLIFHSYLLFPMLLSSLAKKKKPLLWNQKTENTPHQISILMSVYNEEEVIEEKILSILSSDFDPARYEIWVGSDCSTDSTNQIVQKLSHLYPNQVHFQAFTTRQGKPNIINQLINNASGSILVLTDANVIFEKNTLQELIDPFEDAAVGLVDTQMVNKGARAAGISLQEKAYISREVNIKYHESLLWGCMMGPFGGCFALRKDLYAPVPNNFLVDDFYLNMIVLEKGYKAINNPKAVVFEDVSNDLTIEYKRKIRIATGNFQNLFRFSNLLWPLWTGLSFSFLSHKVIRWLGPFLLLIAFISLLFLGVSDGFYLILFCFYLGLLLMPLIDYFFKKLNIHISFLRFITHFCAMNLALFVGFMRYIKGVKSNVWQPTKRNQ